MKYLLITLALLNLNSIFGQSELVQSKSDFGITENIIETEEKTYNMILISGFNNEPAEQYKLRKTENFYFNSNGFLTEKHSNNGKKDIKITKYTFSTSGLLTELNRHDGLKFVFEYNQNNLLTKKNIFARDEITSILINTYDESGKIISSNDKTFGYFKNEEQCNYNYNSSNRLDSSNCTYQDESRLEKRYVYNADNLKLSEESNLFKKDSSILQTIYTYNKNEIVKKKQTNYDSKQVLTTEKVWEYKNNGLESSFSIASLNLQNELSKEKEVLTSYDDRRNITETKTTSYNLDKSKTSKFQYSYKYDEFGNWIIKCLKKDNEPQSVVSRLIKYSNDFETKVSKEESILFCEPQYKEKLREFKKKENSNIIIKEIDDKG